MTPWRAAPEMLSADEVRSVVRPYLRGVASLSNPAARTQWQEKRRTILRWTLNKQTFATGVFVAEVVERRETSA